ncbi:MAG: DoxX family membrane protein [Ignavibacteriales bacterium]|nr:DoxX family membrane protein [Ignavibacteriales bacterium]
MKEIISNKYLLLVSRLVLGFIFIYAAVEKIADPSGFADSIYNYKILPPYFINIIAIVIPWIEFIAGLFLIFGVAIKENAFIINTFLVLFLFLITISLFRGLNIDCGCFGTVGGESVGIKKIIEDVLLLLLGIQIYYFDSKSFSINSIKTNGIKNQ